MLRSSIIRLIGSLLIVTPLLTGCWDRTEIESLAVVLGIGIDLADPEDQQPSVPDVTHTEEPSSAPQSPMIHLTAQLAVPGQIPLGPGGGGGGGKGATPTQAVWVVGADGHTVNDALVHLQQRVAGRLYLSHLRITAVSEKFLRRVGVDNLNDFLRRNSEIRRTGYVVVTKEKAAEVISAAPPLERVPTLYLSSSIKQAVQSGTLPGGMVGEYLIMTQNKGQEPRIPYVNVTGKQNVEIIGMACLKEHKMVDSITPIQVATYNELTGVRAGGYTIYVPVPSISTHVMFKSVSRKTSIHVRLVNGRPYIQVHPYVQGYVVEKSGERGSLDNQKILQEIETEGAKLMEESSKKLIQQMQADGSDIFGFGEYVRGRQPRYWDRYVGTKEKWEQQFKDLPIDVHVTITLLRMQMKAK